VGKKEVHSEFWWRDLWESFYVEDRN